MRQSSFYVFDGTPITQTRLPARSVSGGAEGQVEQIVADQIILNHKNPPERHGQVSVTYLVGRQVCML